VNGRTTFKNSKEDYKLMKIRIIHLGKAAEIAEMSTSDFKEALAERGIVRAIKSTKERVKKGVAIIRKSRR